MSIKCGRCGNQREPPQEIPYVGVLGEMITAGVCSECWTEWEDTQIKLMNEYRVDLSTKEHRDLMRNMMKDFLKLK
ncbi:MAG: Fe(2+)-trafficking protein [Nitrososphaerales archaeon]